ncbi:MAG TPA: AAC(3) family N-acetyltransferase [Hyalangium sp.]|nr:AAC(3) family N-acetyltransferase [Hyalangium sp.]
MHTKISSPVLVQQLQELGVRAGAPLMVHASLRSVGPVEGGASGLLDALIEVLGPGSTLLMVLGASQETPFDALSSKVEEGMGVLAEVFRQRAGVRVNDHAAARYAAMGAQSLQLLEPVLLHDYHGPGSVLDRFTALGGSVLRLGADIDTVTLTHLAEYRANVPDKRRVRLRYVRADIGEQWIESLDDTDGITDWPHGDYFSQILIDFLAAGHARTGRVGNCTAELFAAQPFVGFAIAWMEKHLG